VLSIASRLSYLNGDQQLTLVTIEHPSEVTSTKGGKEIIDDTVKPRYTVQLGSRGLNVMPYGNVILRVRKVIIKSTVPGY
jgi:hypothetical protein